MLLARPALVRVPADLGAVTSDGPTTDADPRSLGVTRDGVASIWRAVEDLYRTGVHPAIALCIRRHGEIIINRAIGHLRGNGPGASPGTPAVPIAADSPFCIFSASKAVTAMLMHLLDDRGLTHIDDRVTEYIPEFGAHGKETTTIRHILTHRSGIPSVSEAGDKLDLLLDPERIVEVLCAAEPTWKPGRRLAYHAVTGGFVLAEIIRRVTGRNVREFLRDEVLDPLGFRWMNYGIADEDADKVAENAFTGRPALFPLSLVVERALGVTFAEAAQVSNDPRWLRGIVPSGNICATAEEVSRFYQLLLDEGALGDVRIFDRRTVHRATSEASYLEIDLTLGLPIRYGLGMMLGSEHFSLYGPRTPRAFGHIGLSQVVTWADPDRDIACALLTSGKPFVGAHLIRTYGVLQAISEHCAPVPRRPART
ncbi:MAG: beta-lactamase family protein [Deltaproteobacteria bacterium]|nr:beta-lactamase family protein [Deltaproteobacteria bacterium]MCB9785061.1 beta-lactamase family protein [Deltaproteobacteria bacterium]